MGQIVEVKAKLLHFSWYNKRNKETKEFTGEKGYKVGLLLNANSEINETSICEYFPRVDVYKGNIEELVDYKVLDNVDVILDVPVTNNGFTQLISITKAKK